jgi:hypothetical protein
MASACLMIAKTTVPPLGAAEQFLSQDMERRLAAGLVGARQSFGFSGQCPDVTRTACAGGATESGRAAHTSRIHGCR